MARSTADRLAGYQRRYRNLAAQLADIGYIAAGSLAQRHNRCGKTNGPPRRPAPAPWPVLAVDHQGQRKDRQPAAHPK
jgi:hypothetical protein